MTRPLTIWCNARLPAESEDILRRELAAHRLIFSDKRQHNLTVGGPDPSLYDAHVAFGQPNVDDIVNAPRLRWIHLTSAGYTRYDTDEFRQLCASRDLILTNSSNVYDEPCAQHIVAFLYAHARQLPWTMREQLTTRNWPGGAVRKSCTLLGGQRVLLYGYGAIARRLVQLLAPLQLDIVGVRRRPTGDEAVTTVSCAEADQLLGQADYVINILPANPDSEGFFSADRIARFKPGCVFMNIGRGITVDQDALLQALQAERIAAAWLDVTTPEPLPPDHPLWQHPRCYITPHAAGGHSTEHLRLVRHFLDNFSRFIASSPLLNRIM